MANAALPGKHSISATIDVAAPREEVWRVLDDFSAVDTWAPSVTKSYALGAADRGIGARRHCDIAGFGGIDETVSEWREGYVFAYSVTPLGPIAASHSRWTLEEIGPSRTRVTTELAYDIRFGAFGVLLHALVIRPKLRSSFPDSLKALKQRVETGELVRPRRAPDGRPQLASATA